MQEKGTIKKDLLIPKLAYKDQDGNNLNAIRMGFASLDEREMMEAVGVLEGVLSKI